MKLPIKKKYFDQIKSGEKTIDLRDAHITFVCVETGETLRKDIVNTRIIKNLGLYPDVLEEERLVEFEL